MGSYNLTNAQLSTTLAKRDLSNPEEGIHAVNIVVDQIDQALRKAWSISPEVHRRLPIVTVAENYDRLYYPGDAPARSERYARYLGHNLMLRTQMTSSIPELLSQIRGEEVDRVLLCPGIVYRRDCVDRSHVGEPHQLDIWRITDGTRLNDGDLRDMIACIVEALLPGRHWRIQATDHHYTTDGLEVEVEIDGRWLEILECGLIHPRLLVDAGLEPDLWSGLAMGIGLDRMVMLIKGLDDIRLLRSTNTQVARQMDNLNPWQPVSKYQATTRDLSIAIHSGTELEEIGDRLRLALGDEAELIEDVSLLSRHPASALPQKVRERLGLRLDQENLLLRIILRSIDGEIGREAGNQIYDRVYTALHEGDTAGYSR
jgi:phenylalanyl-tRNA synthetase alpha chain